MSIWNSVGAPPVNHEVRQQHGKNSAACDCGHFALSQVTDCPYIHDPKVLDHSPSLSKALFCRVGTSEVNYLVVNQRWTLSTHSGKLSLSRD